MLCFVLWKMENVVGEAKALFPFAFTFHHHVCFILGIFLNRILPLPLPQTTWVESSEWIFFVVSFNHLMNRESIKKSRKKKRREKRKAVQSLNERAQQNRTREEEKEEEEEEDKRHKMKTSSKSHFFMLIIIHISISSSLTHSLLIPHPLILKKSRSFSFSSFWVAYFHSSGSLFPSAQHSALETGAGNSRIEARAQREEKK